MGKESGRYNIMMYSQQSLTIDSIIDSMDFKLAFQKIVNHFDPNRGKNRKTKILDCSNFYIWNEEDLKMYDITKTSNLTGYVKESKFDIIIFDPPCNKSLGVITIEYGKVFHEILNNNGVIIVRSKDFKEGDTLRGSFDVKLSMQYCNLYLTNQIIYKYKKYGYKEDSKGIDIIHSYFMVFKKCQSK